MSTDAGLLYSLVCADSNLYLFFCIQNVNYKPLFIVGTVTHKVNLKTSCSFPRWRWGSIAQTRFQVTFQKLLQNLMYIFNRIFYWLTNFLTEWCRITRQWLWPWAWFFRCSMSLQLKMCLLPYHCTRNAFFMDLLVPSFVSHHRYSMVSFIFACHKRCRFYGRYVMASIRKWKSSVIFIVANLIFSNSCWLNTVV